MKRTEPDPVPSPVNPRGVKRARRPAAHFLDLDQIDHLLETAWGLAREDRTQYANALRTEVAIFTGLRTGELHNLCPEDIREDGTLAVRMAPNLKMGKPRVTGFVNGLETSPTLEVLRRFVENKKPGRPIWPSQPAAWSHWVVHRLGPASGLQRRIECLNGNPRERRYLIHCHLTRALFVIFCRRYPRRLGLKPIPWETICELGGWESVDTIRKHYYYADLDEALENVRTSIPAPRAPAPHRPPVLWGRGEAYAP